MNVGRHLGATGVRAPDMAVKLGRDGPSFVFSSRTEAALHYQEGGFRVFPLGEGKRPLQNCRLCRAKKCGGPQDCECGNALCHSFYAAVSDRDQAREWFTQHPGWNLGVSTGAGSGLVVLDVDFGAGGLVTMEALRASGLSTVGCPVVVSGSGGSVHYYFRHPGWDSTVKTSAGAIGPGVDVRGDGGYAVGASSRHPKTGRPYELFGDLATLPPWPFPAANAVQPDTGGPRQLRQAVTVTSEGSVSPKRASISVAEPLTPTRVEGWASIVRRTRVGGRRAALYWAACRLAEATGTAQERREGALVLADAALATGLAGREVVATIVDALSDAQ